MRGPEDIIKVKLALQCSLSLDWERIEEDPGWEEASKGLNLEDPIHRTAALQRYIAWYVNRELLFQEMPSTNGPGEAFVTSIDIYGK